MKITALQFVGIMTKLRKQHAEKIEELSNARNHFVEKVLDESLSRTSERLDFYRKAANRKSQEIQDLNRWFDAFVETIKSQVEGVGDDFYHEE